MVLRPVSTVLAVLAPCIAAAQTVTAVHPSTAGQIRGADFVEMLRVNVNVASATTLTRLGISSLNTSDLDVAVVSCYFTGASPAFSTATPFGEVNSIFASATGSQSATAQAGTWTNGAAALLDGAGAASASTEGASHEFSAFGFSIPAGARINGIVVTTDAWNSGMGKGRLGYQLSWNGGASWTTELELNADLPATEATQTFGSADDPDFWGRRFSDAELSGANFRLRLVARKLGGQSPAWNLDWVRVAVSYTSSGGSVAFGGTQALSAGDNYFHVVYAVSERASSGNVLDAEVPINGVTLSSGSYPSAAVSPAGSRSILAGTNALFFADLEGSLTGWTRTTLSDMCSGTAPHPGWASSSAYYASPATSWFWKNKSCPGNPVEGKSNGEWLLDTPSVAIPASATDLALTFWQKLDVEATFDGVFLQHQVNGGAWQDVAGTRIRRNSYNSTLGSTAASANHECWNGKPYSFRFVKVTVDLSGLGIAGNSLKVRFRAEQDNYVAAQGYWFDDLTIKGGTVSGGGGVNGTPCTSGTDCASGFCADGVCCDTACGGACDACSVAAGASADGACTLLGNAMMCRASADVCDVAESCTGASAACPVDGFASSTTVCRASADVCDVAESCTGASAVCPADGFASSTAVCRASADVCDVVESCTGSSAACPVDGFASSTAVCRASADVCDVVESCTGASASCPADGFASSTTVCRAPADVCDLVESCTGASAGCPADGFASNTTVCRASVDVCDVAESCAGASASCPADGFASSTTVCRAPADVCDLVESCTGASAGCPADGFAS
ncbi:MAG: hypothetical protein HYZ28_10275, partial [Myxococcales bacterium]|nr:hypothetical protein [Myxococcales bacterium]